MKKITNKILFIGLAVILVASTISIICICKSSDQIVENQKIEKSGISTTFNIETEDFSRIVNECNANIELTQSENYQIEVTCDANFKDLLITENHNGELRFYVSDERYNNETFKIKVSAPNYTDIINDGVGSIKCQKIAGENIRIDNDGVGQIEIDSVKYNTVSIENMGVGSIKITLESDAVKATNEGVGTISIQGKTNYAELSNQGVGSIIANKLECEDMQTNDDGIGKIVVK